MNWVLFIGFFNFYDNKIPHSYNVNYFYASIKCVSKSLWSLDKRWKNILIVYTDCFCYYNDIFESLKILAARSFIRYLYLWVLIIFKNHLNFILLTKKNYMNFLEQKTK